MSLTLDRFARQLDWNLLRTFLVIAEEQSVTRAAKRLFLSQPTISGALRRLEDRLGCRLIARGPGHFELTQAGRELHAHCVKIHGIVAGISDINPKAKQEFVGTVRIRTISGVSCEPLDSAIAEFSRSNPTVQFEVHVGHSRDNVAAVINEASPLGVSLYRQEAPNVDYHLLWQEPFDIYCAPTHPLFGQDVESLESLRNSTWVEFACERDNARMHPLATLKRTHGIGDRVVAIADSAEELRLLLRRGIGVGYLPCHIAAADVRDGKLRRVISAIKPPTVDIFMATNTRMNVSAVEAAFCATLSTRLKGIANAINHQGIVPRESAAANAIAD